MKIAKIHIKNLLVRTIIGLHPWERTEKQDVIINIDFETDIEGLKDTDNETDIVNYRTISKDIMHDVESKSFFLLETLTDHVLKMVMSDKRILSAKVKIDKPHALRFAESVSVELSSAR
ncbi:MAG: D-erythro-7,8-dihydroneopterin triphosphate 2'-epimerase [uncultured bacterium]|nr:MAG: D-erythro-7,8-dihydroneopterin triphosphate 2'-epimerase [uncultured bacterium]